MTKMLLVVCVVYCVCTIPAATQTVVRLLVPEFVASGRYNNAFYAALCISHLLESVNCSVNFVIYYTMSSKFNSTLREMFHLQDKKVKEREEQEPRTRVSVVSATSEGG
nr:hypothetical protein BaRGS_009204 [Batillaria attramentaria]